MSENLNKDLIAPCGMNCGICMAYLRGHNQCGGCWSDNVRGKSCERCVIRNCAHLKETTSSFCYDCEIFPCARLKRLDKRYSEKYNMSMLDNLAYIKAYGVISFIRKEQSRWRCVHCGGAINVHRNECSKCKRAGMLPAHQSPK